MSDVERRVAVVTGAGRGIGAAIATALSEAGVEVILAARSRDQIERLASEISRAGRPATALACDVTDEASVAELARRASDVGPIGVLVNNAGAASSSPVARTSLDEWNRLFSVNATGAFLC